MILEYPVLKAKLRAKLNTIWAKIGFWVAIFLTILCVIEAIVERSHTFDNLIAIFIIWVIYLMVKFDAKLDRKYAEKIEKEYNSEKKN